MRESVIATLSVLCQPFVIMDTMLGAPISGFVVALGAMLALSGWAARRNQIKKTAHSPTDQRFLAYFIAQLESINDRLGRCIAWVTLAMVLTVILVVILRYVFSIGWVALQESYVWMHGLTFMLGAGYTLLRDKHVRVDILYQAASKRGRAYIDLFGSACLTLPVMVLVWLVSQSYVVDSWQRWEGSREAGGLEGLFLLKTCQLIFALSVSIQAVAMGLRSIMTLTETQNEDVQS